MNNVEEDVHLHPWCYTKKDEKQSGTQKCNKDEDCKIMTTCSGNCGVFWHWP